jgi:HSP20 family protein
MIYHWRESMAGPSEGPSLTERGYDADVTFEQGRLTIRSKRSRASENGDARWFLRERWHGESVRSVVLPESVEGDKAKATFEAGVLTLAIPKHEAAKPKKIAVTTVKGK